MNLSDEGSDANRRGYLARLDPVRNDLLHRMYERLVSTWIGPEPIPRGLSELETIHWCLTPRDK